MTVGKLLETIRRNLKEGWITKETELVIAEPVQPNESPGYLKMCPWSLASMCGPREGWPTGTFCLIPDYPKYFRKKSPQPGADLEGWARKLARLDQERLNAKAARQSAKLGIEVKPQKSYYRFSE